MKFFFGMVCLFMLCSSELYTMKQPTDLQPGEGSSSGASRGYNLNGVVPRFATDPSNAGIFTDSMQQDSAEIAEELNEATHEGVPLSQIYNDPGYRDSDGNTRLHLAVRNGNAEEVEKMLAAGDPVLVKNNNEEIPLCFAFEWQQIVDLLLPAYLKFSSYFNLTILDLLRTKFENVNDETKLSHLNNAIGLFVHELENQRCPAFLFKMIMDAAINNQGWNIPLIKKLFGLLPGEKIRDYSVYTLFKAMCDPTKDLYIGTDNEDFLKSLFTTYGVNQFLITALNVNDYDVIKLFIDNNVRINISHILYACSNEQSYFQNQRMGDLLMQSAYQSIGKESIAEQLVADVLTGKGWRQMILSLSAQSNWYQAGIGVIKIYINLIRRLIQDGACLENTNIINIIQQLPPLAPEDEWGPFIQLFLTDLSALFSQCAQEQQASRAAASDAAEPDDTQEEDEEGVQRPKKKRKKG